MATYKEFHQYSIEKPNEFWTEQAQLIDWKEPFTQVFDYSKPPFVKWFVGGKTNLCHNAIDRHAAKRPNDRALIYISTETNAIMPTSDVTFSDGATHAPAPRGESNPLDAKETMTPIITALSVESSRVGRSMFVPGKSESIS